MIPNRLIFVWFGSRLPDAARIAIRSAARWCRPEELWLLHEGLDADDPEIRALVEEVGLDLRDAGPQWFDGIPAAEVARGLYETMSWPASRSNLLRLAALHRHGGVYLDTDTICVRDLAPLREHEGFCGRERLTMPGDLVRSRNPLRWGAAGVRMGVRAALSAVPQGDRVFRRIGRLYPEAVNNAVIGARAGNPVIGAAFERMAEIDPEERTRRFRLGTHLMQEVTDNRSGPHMEVLPPEAFYPLGPEISMHWFRSGTADRLDRLVRPDTYVVHWYSSLEKKLREPITTRWIREDAQRTAFSALAREYV